LGRNERSKIIARKTKPTDWRKERRANEGSIRERNGKVYARIQLR
jgi:hypothetical protein